MRCARRFQSQLLVSTRRHQRGDVRVERLFRALAIAFVACARGAALGTLAHLGVRPGPYPGRRNLARSYKYFAICFSHRCRTGKIRWPDPANSGARCGSAKPDGWRDAPAPGLSTPRSHRIEAMRGDGCAKLLRRIAPDLEY